MIHRKFTIPYTSAIVLGMYSYILNITGKNFLKLGKRLYVKKNNSRDMIKIVLSIENYYTTNFS